MKIVEKLETILGKQKALEAKSAIDSWLKEQTKKNRNRDNAKQRITEKKAEEYASYVKQEMIKEGEKYGKYVKRETLKEARKQINLITNKAQEYANLVREEVISEGEKYGKLVESETRKDYEKYLGEAFVKYVDSINKDIEKAIVNEQKVKHETNKYQSVIKEIAGLLEYRLGNKRVDNKLREDLKEAKKQNFIFSKKLEEQTEEKKKLEEQVDIKKRSINLPKSDRVKLRKSFVKKTNLKENKIKIEKPTLNENSRMKRLKELSGIA